MRLSSLQSANNQSRQRELDAQLFHFCVVIDLAQSENGNPSVLPEIELTYAWHFASCLLLERICSGADVTKLSLWASLPQPLSPPAIVRWLEPTSISNAVMHLSTCATSMGLSREPVTSK
jgi:hypothetical protein